MPRGKMINQLLAGVHIAAAAEAMAFGIRAGADPEQLYEVICNSAGSSWMFQNRSRTSWRAIIRRCLLWAPSTWGGAWRGGP